MQRRIKTARRAFRAAVRRLGWRWIELVARLDRAVGRWRLGESEADDQTATDEREAA